MHVTTWLTQAAVSRTSRTRKATARRMSTTAGLTLIAVVVVLRILMLCSPVLANEPAIPPMRRDAVVELEIPKGGDLPIITIETLGKKLRFLVKSNCPITTYDVAWRSQLGTVLRSDPIEGADGRIYQVPYFRAPKLRIESLQPSLDQVAMTDLSLLSEMATEKIDGCLGLDVLRQFVVVLDCDRGVLQLRPSLPVEPGEEVPFEFDKDDRPAVAVAFGAQHPTPFAVCTGSTAAMLLQPPLFAELRDKNLIRSTNPTIATTELGSQGATGVANHVSLGPFVHRSVSVEAFGFDGIGMQYLARYIVTLDLPQRRAYFKPGKDFDHIDRLDQSGLYFVRRRDEIVVDGVGANSPASECGILVGDALRRINDTPISAFSTLDLRRILRSTAKPVPIVVERDGESIAFQLSPRNYLDIAAESERRAAARPLKDAVNGGTIIAEFDVGRRGEPLVVPVSIEGFDRPLNMLVDTGSPWTTFDERVRKRLGTAVGRQRITTPDGASSMCEQFRLGGASLGGVQLTRASIALADDFMIENFRNFFGYDDLDGVIGMDLLHSQVVQIDFDAGKLRLLSAIGDGCGRRVDIVCRPSGIPALEMSIGRLERRWFVADTGLATWNCCRDDVFSALNASGAVHDVRPGYRLVNSGGIVRKRWRVDQMKLGQFAHRNVGFVSAQTNALGLFYLSRYLVTFDFPGGALYMKDGKLYDRAEPFDMSGLHIIKRHGEYFVFDVSPGSPAHRAGFVAGDVILRTNGQDIMKHSLFEIHEMLSDAGKSVTLALLRDGVQMEHKIVLQDYSTGRIAKAQKDIPPALPSNDNSARKR